MYNRVMKKKIVLLLIVVLVLWFFASQNFYSPLFNVIRCDEPYACLHEKGHQVDTRNASVRIFKSQWTSSSKEFEDAVQSYITDYCFYGHGWRDGEKICKIMFAYPGIENPHMAYREFVKIHNPFIIGFVGGWGGYYELYADIWAVCNGNIEEIPLDLQLFYQ